MFLGLGWMGGLALPQVWIRAGAAPGTLMLAGGLLYTAGAISYHHRWPDPCPSVFGYHEVFHAYVCAAAACQFIGIALFISSAGQPPASCSQRLAGRAHGAWPSHRFGASGCGWPVTPARRALAAPAWPGPARMSAGACRQTSHAAAPSGMGGR